MGHSYWSPVPPGMLTRAGRVHGAKHWVAASPGEQNGLCLLGPLQDRITGREVCSSADIHIFGKGITSGASKGSLVTTFCLWPLTAGLLSWV